MELNIKQPEIKKSQIERAQAFIVWLYIIGFFAFIVLVEELGLGEYSEKAFLKDANYLFVAISLFIGALCWFFVAKLKAKYKDQFKELNNAFNDKTGKTEFPKVVAKIAYGILIFFAIFVYIILIWLASENMLPNSILGKLFFFLAPPIGGVIIYIILKLWKR